METPTASCKPTEEEAIDKDEFSTVEAKKWFAHLLSRASYGDERILITKNGRLRGALIGVRDLARLQGAV